MFEITKEIGIDAAHRIPRHESKCRNLHGHRYTIQATARSKSLHTEGSQTGMAMDFKFLKELMVELIDTPCDHGTIVCLDDTELVAMLRLDSGVSLREITYAVQACGSYSLEGRFGKTLYVPFAPTAENLAAFWYNALAQRVPVSSDGYAVISHIRVWETPSSCADYPAKF